MQGLSTELGAFVAGVMMSATEQQENTLHQLEPLKQFFLSLFICSTGLIMSPTFLAQHLRVLAGGLVVTVLSKTVLVSPESSTITPPDPGSALAAHSPASLAGGLIVTVLVSRNFWPSPSMQQSGCPRPPRAY